MPQKVNMFKLIQALRGLNAAFVAKQYAAACERVADILDAMNKSEAASALRALIQGVEDASAHDIAVAVARQVFDLLEGYYGESFPHVRVMALADDDACAERADNLAEYMSQHTEQGVTGGGRLKAVPLDVWLALANVLASSILNFINKRKAGV